jgi:GMP synthase-like glutamine amidotransferase
MRIGVLETGHNSDLLAARFGRLFDNFQAWLDAHRDEFPIELRAYWVENGELPAAVDECDGYIITGSAASVYEDHAWLVAVNAFIGEAIQMRTRLLGVCFGHQLIAQALGGRVEKSAKGWGIGRHTYEVTKRMPWMDPALESFSLLACHQDQIAELPVDAEVLASSEFCEFAMFAVGDHVMTVQAHPEFRADYAGSLYESRREWFGDAATNQGLASVDERTDAGAFARWALRFLMTESCTGAPAKAALAALADE